VGKAGRIFTFVMEDNGTRPNDRSIRSIPEESGHYFGPRVRLLVQVFCDSKEPLGAKEMLYRVKRLDPLVSFGTVYRFLTLLAASGLATTIPRERRGPLRFKKVTTPVQWANVTMRIWSARTAARLSKKRVILTARQRSSNHLLPWKPTLFRLTMLG